MKNGIEMINFLILKSIEFIREMNKKMVLNDLNKHSTEQTK